MNPVAPRGTTPQDPVQHLKVERRSYIIGTLLVWAVILTSVMVLLASMRPELFSPTGAHDLHSAMQRINQSKLTWEQQSLLDIIMLVGAVALFFLNWRFSYLLQRPRWAFSAPPGAVSGRWFWWFILALNSMLYLSLLIPQLITTAVLAAWGKQELDQMSGRTHGSPS